MSHNPVVSHDIPIPAPKRGFAEKPFTFNFAALDKQGASFFEGGNEGHLDAFTKEAKRYGAKHSIRLSLYDVTENGVKGVRVWHNGPRTTRPKKAA